MLQELNRVPLQFDPTSASQGAQIFRLQDSVAVGTSPEFAALLRQGVMFKAQICTTIATRRRYV